MTLSDLLTAICFIEPVVAVVATLHRPCLALTIADPIGVGCVWGLGRTLRVIAFRCERYFRSPALGFGFLFDPMLLWAKIGVALSHVLLMRS